jgi:hypothetical protein
MKENMEPGTIADIDGYFVDENKERVTGLIQKREYSVEDYNLVLDSQKISAAILQTEDVAEWRLRMKMSQILDVPLYLALWPIDYPMEHVTAISKPVIVYSIRSNNSDLNFKPEFTDGIDRLATFIRSLRGGRSFGSVKNLKVGTTMMECYLAKKTADPWPGNLDAAVFDIKREIGTAIIEFKTHNYPEYRIQTQYFGQWPRDDRRYRVLDIMQKHFEFNSVRPRFIYAIWGTDKSHVSVKLQTIDNLKPTNDEFVNRPEFTAATTADFTRDMLKYINS